MSDAGHLPFGLVGRPHGLAGELVLRPFNAGGWPERAAPPVAARLVLPGRWEDHQLVAVRPFGDDWLVRFEGIADRDAAARLVNAELHLPRAALDALGEDEFYVEDLVGCVVLDLQGRTRGVVKHAYWNGAHDVLTVEGEGGAELLIPAVPEFIRAVDLDARRVIVDPHE